MSIQRARQYILNQKACQALNAFVHTPQDVAAIQAAAAEAEARASAGKRKSLVDGEVIAVKDNICTSDQPTTCASRMLEGFISPFAATVVQKLQAAGAIIAGKTNLDEFGMGSHSLHSAFGPVYQRHEDRELSVGGSSGGSAIAVATSQCWAALGTDTGGSVRLPAAYNNIYGFKPSYGIVSRHGVVAYANSLDTVGIMAQDWRPIDELFKLVRAHDPQDPTSLSPSTRERINQRVSRRPTRDHLRIGVPLEYNIAELADPVRTIWKRALLTLAREGHAIVPVSLPSTKLALSAYYILAPAEASSNLAKYDGVRYGNPASTPKNPENVLFATTRGAGLGEEVRRRILLGSFTLSASAVDNYFIKAQRVRRLVQRDFDTVFALSNPLLDQELKLTSHVGVEGVDVLLSPTAPSLPPRLSDLSARTALDSYQDDVLTVPASLAGLPAMSIPVVKLEPALCEQEHCKHIGLQITAQYGDDEMVFHAAKLLQNLEADPELSYG